VGVGRGLGLDDEALERVGGVARLVLVVLEVALQLTRVGVEGDGGVRVQHVSIARAALDGAPRDGYGDAVVDEVQLGVVTGRVPGRAAAAGLVGHVTPSIATGFARGGDGVRAPEIGRAHV